MPVATFNPLVVEKVESPLRVPLITLMLFKISPEFTTMLLVLFPNKVSVSKITLEPSTIRVAVATPPDKHLQAVKLEMVELIIASEILKPVLPQL